MDDDDNVSVKIENKDLTDSDGTQPTKLYQVNIRINVISFCFPEEGKENREKHTEIQEQ